VIAPGGVLAGRGREQGGEARAVDQALLSGNFFEFLVPFETVV